MNPEFDQARAVMKSIADARAAGKPIDLASLPEPLRSKLQAQLQRLPPQMQQELLARGSPLLDKAIERAGQAGGKAAQVIGNATQVIGTAADPTKPRSWQNTGVLPGDYHGHYNNTIRPGDSMQLTIGRLLMFFVAAAGLYYFWQRLVGG